MSLSGAANTNVPKGALPQPSGDVEPKAPVASDAEFEDPVTKVGYSQDSVRPPRALDPLMQDFSSTQPIQPVQRPPFPSRPFDPQAMESIPPQRSNASQQRARQMGALRLNPQSVPPPGLSTQQQLALGKQHGPHQLPQHHNHTIPLNHELGMAPEQPRRRWPTSSNIRSQGDQSYFASLDEVRSGFQSPKSVSFAPLPAPSTKSKKQSKETPLRNRPENMDKVESGRVKKDKASSKKSSKARVDSELAIGAQSTDGKNKASSKKSRIRADSDLSRALSENDEITSLDGFGSPEERMLSFGKGDAEIPGFPGAIYSIDDKGVMKLKVPDDSDKYAVERAFDPLVVGDFTSFNEDQKGYSSKNLPAALGFIMFPYIKKDFPLLLDSRGRSVTGPRDTPLRDIPFLPLQISRQVEGWLIDYWQIKGAALYEIVIRTLPGPKQKTFTQDRNMLSMRGQRFRFENGRIARQPNVDEGRANSQIRDTLMRLHPLEILFGVSWPLIYNDGLRAWCMESGTHLVYRFPNESRVDQTIYNALVDMGLRVPTLLNFVVLAIYYDAGINPYHDIHANLGWTGVYPDLQPSQKAAVVPELPLPEYELLWDPNKYPRSFRVINPDESEGAAERHRRAAISSPASIKDAKANYDAAVNYRAMVIQGGSRSLAIVDQRTNVEQGIGVPGEQAMVDQRTNVAQVGLDKPAFVNPRTNLKQDGPSSLAVCNRDTNAEPCAPGGSADEPDALGSSADDEQDPLGSPANGLCAI